MWVTQNMRTGGRVKPFCPVSVIIHKPGPARGLVRLCWAMSGKSVFDGVRQVSFVSKLLKNYSLESETEWQLWAVEGFGIPGESPYL